jgi:integrase/recombinase XerD
LYNPAEPLKLPKQPSTLPKGVMTEEQIELMLSQADINTAIGFRNRTVMEVLYSTGIRSSELCKLQLKDIDLIQMRIHVQGAKNREERILPLGEIACNYLKEYQSQARSKLASRAAAFGHKPDPDKLFLSKSGQPMLTRTVTRIVQDYRKKAGLPANVTAHSFRHSCATHMLKRGADIRYIQELLGHRSISSTQIYTRVEPIDLKVMHQKFHPREQFEEKEYDFE